MKTKLEELQKRLNALYDELDEAIEHEAIQFQTYRLIKLSVNELEDHFNSVLSEGISQDDMHTRIDYIDIGIHSDEYLEAYRHGMIWANGQLTKRLS